MHNYRLRLYLVCALIFSGIAHGQTATVTPVAVNSASINASGNVVAMHTYRAQYGSNPASYYSRAVEYNKATTGKLGKARAFVKGNALQLGIAGAILAVGWSLDEITKDVYTSAGTTDPYTVTGTYYYKTIDFAGNYQTGPYSSQSMWGAAQKWWAAYGNLGPNYRLEILPSDCNLYSCRFRSMEISPYRQHTATYIRLYNGAGYATDKPATYNPPLPTGIESGKPTTPVTATDSQMHDAMFPQPQWQNNGYLGDNLPELLRDPVSGAVENTQEVQNVATQIQNEVNLQNNPASTPVTAPTVDPNYTSTTNNPAPTDMPAFCGWASSVCDFINWFKTDTTTEPTTDLLPESQLTYETPTWSSGLGGGTCPSPQSFSVLGGTFEVSYQPWCDLAGMLKYLVLALAYITSAIIISGVRR